MEPGARVKIGNEDTREACSLSPTFLTSYISRTHAGTYLSPHESPPDTIMELGFWGNRKGNMDCRSFYAHDTSLDVIYHRSATEAIYLGGGGGGER